MCCSEATTKTLVGLSFFRTHGSTASTAPPSGVSQYEFITLHRSLVSALTKEVVPNSCFWISDVAYICADISMSSAAAFSLCNTPERAVQLNPSHPILAAGLIWISRPLVVPQRRRTFTTSTSVHKQQCVGKRPTRHVEGKKTSRGNYNKALFYDGS